MVSATRSSSSKSTVSSCTRLGLIATVHRAFKTFGAFTSGIGVHYAPSAIVNTTHQAHASKLIIGQRMLPQVFVRAADARPFEIQDLLPADTRYKVLVFAGNPTDAGQLARVRALAAAFERPEGFFKRFGGAEPTKVFDVLAICAASKDRVNYTDLPPVFRSHWSKYVQFLFLRRCRDGLTFWLLAIDEQVNGPPACPPELPIEMEAVVLSGIHIGPAWRPVDQR